MKALFWLWISGMTTCWEVIALRSGTAHGQAAPADRLTDYLAGR